MLLSLNWLKDFVSLPKNISPEDLAKKLTLHTVEVEKIENQAQRFAKVVVGQILEVKKHPNADRLQIALVDTGKDKLSIVCGAPNIAPGQLVPVALEGALLPNGLEIKATEVRGEKSNGMLCAEDELGLGGDHSGIMILAKAKIGQKFSDYLKLNDIILEVDNKSLSNRPDLWGHYGIAREISAFLGVKLTEINLDKIKLNEGDKKLDIKVEDTKLCPRYMAIKLDGIEIKDSPSWLQDRLVAVGLRPINNIVDITNYVMLELGQPLHAFDGDKIKQIAIRLAKKDERIETLDEKERKLDNQMLLITDGQKPLAIAGIMGGQNSGITNDTKSIIIESANFDATSIRQTSTKLGLRTDASIRFEKALDPNLTELALKRTIELIKNVCKKAKVTSALTDINNSTLPLELIELDLNWLNKLMGTELPKKRIIEILNSLGFETVEEKNGQLNVKIPSWRATKDISLPEDVAEEIMRIHGYDNFPSCLPEVAMTPAPINYSRELEDKIRDILSQETHLTEVYNYSFVSEDELKKLNLDFSNYLKLANPISQLHTLLRQNLVPGLISNVKTNQYKYDSLGLFELGTIYLDVPGELLLNPKNDARLPHQEKRLGIVLAGSDDLFERVKSIITNLLHGLTNQNLEIDFLPTELNIGYADKFEKAAISIADRAIGTVAKVSGAIAKNSGLKKDTVVAELSFNELMKLNTSAGEKKYQETPKYPPMTRDLAFVIDQKILYNDIRNTIKGFHDLIKSADLFDVYSGANLGGGKKSLAFHVIYQSSDRTLTTAEVDEIQTNLITNLQSKFDAQLRDF
jgi:phenylalanyl-tRNA synthetase beta chain